jgi:FMN phosphatase YigB (HAD superfamily)
MKKVLLSDIDGTLVDSNKAEDLAFYKRLVGMEELVDEEATSSDAQESKPEPDIFAAALKKAGSGAEDAIMTPKRQGRLGIGTIGLTC